MNRPCADLKEREGKKRKSPLTPLREKGKGKKLDPILRDQVYRARVRVREGAGRCRVKQKKFSALQIKAETHEKRFFQLTKILKILNCILEGCAIRSG